VNRSPGNSKVRTCGVEYGMVKLMGRANVDHTRDTAHPGLLRMLQASIKGKDLVISEHNSHGMITKLVTLLQEEYGVELEELWRSMCG